MTESPFVDSGSIPSIINSELPLIQETKTLFKTAGLQCNKFKGDKGKIIWYYVRAKLRVQGEILQVDRQELLNATTTKKLMKLDKYWMRATSISCRSQNSNRSSSDNHSSHVAFQSEDLDTYDSDCDDLSMAQAVLMANISNYGSVHMLTKPQAFYDNTHKQALGYQNPFNLKKAQWIKPTLYDGVVLSNTHVAMHVIDDEETLILEEEIRLKMSKKAKDPEVITKKVSHKPIDYEKLNKTTDDFGKQYFEKNDLKAQLQDKDKTICKLKNTIKSLRKNNKEEIVDHDRCDLATINVELENSMAKLLSENERLFKQAKAKQPLDNALDIACKHAKRILELLVYVQDTCPSAVKLREIKVVQIVLWYLDSRCSKHMTGNHSQLMNFISKFLATVRFGNDQIARIMRYGDYQLGNVIILRVYYVEELGYNLFSIDQLCDVDLEVAFRKNTCFIRNLEAVDLLSGSRDINLYTISLDDMLKSSSICLLSKESKTKSSINGQRYILVTVDDYSRFTWVTFLKTKDEAPVAIIKCIKNIQVRLNATVQNVRTYNGTKIFNHTLHEFYENVGISHQTSVARTPQQNDVVERQNRTLVEVA
nr:retrovirus-related Pol polyprotein from transposon TNT 1-94 [Tanacetum cinerariifolium]